jgi:hypothetical protein
MTSSPSITPHLTGAGSAPDHPIAEAEAAWTRRLLACGAAAAPLWVVVVLVQALTRPGFSLTRDAASLLDLGSLGWVQVTNFIVAGLLVIAGAVGMRRAMPACPGSRWAPKLIAVVGAGLIGGGVFHPDPSGGYPPGAPQGASAVSSWHGVLHMISGTAAFVAMIAVCFVLARRFSAAGQRRTAACSRIAGVLCAVGIAAAGAPGGSLSLFLGVSVAWLWIAAAIARLTTAGGRDQALTGHTRERAQLRAPATQGKTPAV